jgi:protein-tyrosine phosphatase
MYKFAPASENEPIVFGAARPGYRSEQVNQWLEFMQQQEIQRVCCLLTEDQLQHYGNLLDLYQHTFGNDRVCWAPIKDFHIATSNLLIDHILPFLTTANLNHEKAVVHCSGGVGRTGQVLAAWLIAGRGFSKAAAIAAVKHTGRNPYEAVIAAPFVGRNPWKVLAELNLILNEVKTIPNIRH